MFSLSTPSESVRHFVGNDLHRMRVFRVFGDVLPERNPIPNGVSKRSDLLILRALSALELKPLQRTPKRCTQESV